MRLRISKIPTQFVFQLGQRFLNILEAMGEYGIFCWRIMGSVFSKHLKFSRVLKQMFKVGVNSFPIVVVTLIFVGMVFTDQLTSEFSKIGAGKIIGGIVGFAIWRELGPLFAGVVVAARVGAAISSEVAAMKVSEQIDALRAMAISPFAFLYTPWLIALIVMMPLLIVFADFVGFFAGLFIYTGLYHGNPFAYLTSAGYMLTPLDIYAGILFKGPVFGFIIATLAAFIGARTKGGAEGIGKAATLSVVACLVGLFVMNFFLSYLIF